MGGADRTLGQAPLRQPGSREAAVPGVTSRHHSIAHTHPGTQDRGSRNVRKTNVEAGVVPIRLPGAAESHRSASLGLTPALAAAVRARGGGGLRFARHTAGAMQGLAAQTRPRRLSTTLAGRWRGVGNRRI